MADHNTLIGSTTGEIEGATALIGGVGCEIESGLVLAGGVAREIAFGSDKVTINISGSGSSTTCYVTIDGVVYTKAATIEVEPGTEVSCRVWTTTNRVYENGKTVQNSRGTYTYTANVNTDIELSAGNSVAQIYITY